MIALLLLKLLDATLPVAEPPSHVVAAPHCRVRLCLEDECRERRRLERRRVRR